MRHQKQPNQERNLQVLRDQLLSPRRRKLLPKKRHLPRNLLLGKLPPKSKREFLRLRSLILKHQSLRCRRKMIRRRLVSSSRLRQRVQVIPPTSRQGVQDWFIVRSLISLSRNLPSLLLESKRFNHLGSRNRVLERQHLLNKSLTLQRKMCTWLMKRKSKSSQLRSLKKTSMFLLKKISRSNHPRNQYKKKNSQPRRYLHLRKNQRLLDLKSLKRHLNLHW